MPPPRASVVSELPVSVAPATLSATRVSVTVRVPQLAMPPPLANEQSLADETGVVQTGTGWPAVTRLPVIALWLIVTVAPVEPPSATGINTPPPAAKKP